MKSEAIDGVISFVTCDICKIVIAQDRGKPEDVPLIATSVKGHLITPNTFLGKTKHEILTVDPIDGTYFEGLQFKKGHKIN